MPASNRAFWEAKLNATEQRDRTVTRTLRRAGWQVLRIWEHELRQPTRVVRRIERALAGLRGVGGQGGRMAIGGGEARQHLQRDPHRSA